MADIEARVDKLETRVTDLELRTDRIITKLDMFIEESREARQRHDKEIRELRQKHDADMKEMNARFDEKFDKMDAKIDGIGKHVRNITIAAMVGIGAAVTGVAAMVVAVFMK